MKLGFFFNLIFRIKQLRNVLLYVYLYLESKFLLVVPKKLIRENAILLVKVDGIGDYLIFERVLRIAKAKNPELNFHLVCDSSIADLAEASGLFEKLLVINSSKFIRNFWVRNKFMKSMKGIQFKAIICPMRSRNSLTSDSIVAFCLSSLKVGFISDNSNDSPLLNSLTDSWYTQLFAINDVSMHEIVSTTNIMNFCLPNKIDFESSFACHEISLPVSDYYVVCPGSSWRGKNWPVENYLRIINELLRTTSKRIFILGGVSEKDIINLLYSQVSDQTRTFCFSGELGLLESSSLVKGAAMYIGNDTFLAHVAALNCIRTIVVIGGGHYGRFFPYPDFLSNHIRVASNYLDCYGCKWKCYSNDLHKPCLTSIPVSKVYSLVADFIELEEGA